MPTYPRPILVRIAFDFDVTLSITLPEIADVLVSIATVHPESATEPRTLCGQRIDRKGAPTELGTARTMQDAPPLCRYLSKRLVHAPKPLGEAEPWPRRSRLQPASRSRRRPDTRWTSPMQTECEDQL